MSLLEKALRDKQPKEGRSGLFARATLRNNQIPATPIALPEVVDFPAAHEVAQEAEAQSAISVEDRDYIEPDLGAAPEPGRSNIAAQDSGGESLTTLDAYSPTEPMTEFAEVPSHADDYDGDGLEPESSSFTSTPSPGFEKAAELSVIPEAHDARIDATDDLQIAGIMPSEHVDAESPVVPAWPRPPIPISAGDIAALRSELAALAHAPDSILAIYSRIAEALPLDALALLLPNGSGFEVAASLGFVANWEDYVPASLALHFPSPGTPLEGDALSMVSRLLDAPAQRSLFATAYGARAEPQGIWIYGGPMLEQVTDAFNSALSGLFTSPFELGTPALAMETAPQAIAADLSLTGNPADILAISLDIQDLISRIEALNGAICARAISAAALQAMRKLLPATAQVSLSDAHSINVLVPRIAKVDTELFLFQLQKSFRRILLLAPPLLELEGKAEAFAPDDPSLTTKVSTFFHIS